MSDMEPKVAAVIVTYNNASMLRSLLADLLSQSRLPDSIFVIDNASSDATANVVKNSPSQVRYVRLDKNTGSAGGYYEGIRLASGGGDLVWTLDDDVGLRSDTLRRLLDGLADVEPLGKVGAVRCVGEGHPYTVPTRMDAFAWRGTLIKSEAILSAGLPLKEYFMYGEDLEYSLRLSRMGYSFFWVPGSIAAEKRLGKAEGRFLSIKTIFYPEAWRLYYAFRNEIHMYLRYGYFSGALRTVLYGAKVASYIVFMEGWRGSGKIAAILRGMLDGMMLKTGENGKYLPEKSEGTVSDG